MVYPRDVASVPQNVPQVAIPVVDRLIRGQCSRSVSKASNELGPLNRKRLLNYIRKVFTPANPLFQIRVAYVQTRESDLTHNQGGLRN